MGVVGGGVGDAHGGDHGFPAMMVGQFDGQPVVRGSVDQVDGVGVGVGTEVDSSAGLVSDEVWWREQPDGCRHLLADHTRW